MSQHTPGNWILHDQSEPNARLIASAPAILAALKASQKAVEELMIEFVSKKRAANWGVINDAGVAAVRAIARAEQGG